MNPVRWLSLLAGVSLLAVSGTAAGQDHELEIREGPKQVPLAATNFRQTEGAPQPDAGANLRNVLLADLANSGIFRVLHAQPPADGTDLAAAKAAGMQAVIRGDYQVANGEVIWEVRLLDSVFDRQVAGKRYRGLPSWTRSMAHAFADEVVRQYTGKQGVSQTLIAFLVGTGNGKDLYVMDYDGENVRRVTQARSIVVSPSWGADKRQLFYTSYQRGNPDLYRVDLDSGHLETISNVTGLNTAPTLSPDGRTLALTLSRDGNAEIYLYDMRTRGLKRLTYSKSVDTQPTWSPNGNEIAFVSDRTGSPQIYVMDRDGADVRRLTYGISYTTSPAWSPQGDTIAFVGQRDGVFQLMSMSPRGGEIGQITRGGAHCEDPSWSPDGRHLTYSRTAPGRSSEVWVIHADGTDARKLIALGGGCVDPAWSPY